MDYRSFLSEYQQSEETILRTYQTHQKHLHAQFWDLLRKDAVPEDVKRYLGRLKDQVGTATDAELAAEVGVSGPTFSTARNSGSMDLKKFLCFHMLSPYKMAIGTDELWEAVVAVLGELLKRDNRCRYPVSLASVRFLRSTILGWERLTVGNPNRTSRSIRFKQLADPVRFELDDGEFDRFVIECGPAYQCIQDQFIDWFESSDGVER